MKVRQALDPILLSAVVGRGGRSPGRTQPPIRYISIFGRGAAPRPARSSE